MELNQTGRRDLIKNITIIFLIVLLLLTFFSTTIMNRSLPEVATQSAYGGQIVSSVRANGTTEANENYQVIIEEGRVIQSVNVRRGQVIEAGEILFLLEDADSAELQSALDALNGAKMDYTRWKLQTDNAIEDKLQEITYAKEDLRKVREKGVSVSVDTSELEAEIKRLTKDLAVYSLSSAEQAFDEAQAAYEAAKKEYFSAKSAYEETVPAVAEAQAAYDIAKADADNAQTVVDAIQQEISVAEHTRDGEQREMDTAQENVTAVQKTYDDAKQAKLDAELKKEEAEGALKDAEDALKNTQDALKTAQNAVTAAKEQLEQAKETLAEAEADRKEKENELKDKKNSTPSYSSDTSALTSAARHAEDERIALKRMKAKYDEDLDALDDANIEMSDLWQKLLEAEAAYDIAPQEYWETLLAVCNTRKAEYEKKAAEVAGIETLLKEDIKNIEDQTLRVSRAEEDYNELVSEQSASDSQAWEDYRKNVIVPAEKAVEAAKKKEAEEMKAVTRCESAVKTAEADLETVKNEIADSEKALAARETALAAAETAVAARETALAAAEQRLNEVKAILDGESTDVGNTDDTIYAMRDRLFNANIDLQNAQKSLAALEEPALNAAKEAQENAETKMNEAKAAMHTAEAECQTAKENLSLAKESAKLSGKKYTEEELEALIADTKYQLNEKKEQLSELQQSLSSGGYPDEESYREAVKAAERQVETLETDLERTKENNALEEPTYTTAVERAQKEVDRLTDSVGSPVIKAKVGGTVNNITVSAGQKVEAQTVLAEIEQQDKGYTVNLSLTAEQAKRVAVGQTATILYYWGQTPTAVVESVKPDRNDPQNTRIVTLSVTGDITAGQSFTFSLGEKSANYDVIVPKSAVREDSNGSFVYIVKAKSTPVGNRYTAQRLDIEVLASDESNCAVSGLMGGEFIITNSETPITAGQQVRLADNG